MKLSKIIETPNLSSVTIHVIKSDEVKCDIFTNGRPSGKPIKKKYSSLDVDIDIPEISNRNVKHLGIKRNFHLVEDDYYINLYYY